MGSRGVKYEELVRRHRRREALVAILATTLLSIVAMAVAYPLVWVAFMSLKSQSEILANPWSPPTKPRFENYVYALQAGGFLQYLKNSAVVVALVVALMALLAPPAAYALSRPSLRGRKPVLYVLLASMFIAPHVTMVPLYEIMRYFRLIDTHLGLVMAYVSSGIPYVIYIVRSAFLMIPKTLEEAARVDGLSTIQIYLRIMLPIARPALFVALILEALFVWNDFLYPLILLRSKDLFTVPYGLVIFRGMYMIKYGPLSAGIMLATLPMAATYIVVSRYLRSGVAAWMGIKG